MDEEKLKTEKKRLRKELRTRRKELPQEYLLAAGESIENKILSSPEFAAARSIFVYVSVPGEPSTGRIIQKAFAEGKEVFVPKCIGREMFAVSIASPDHLRPGAMGIPEPVEIQEKKTADELDLIIAPCVAASEDGRRLGHGVGFYDRFLQHERANTVCLCFRRLLCPEIPVGSADVMISNIITE